jgi:hypothetical protein
VGVNSLASSDELGDFLRRHHRAVLFCRDELDLPIGYPMRTVAYADQQLLFTTYSKSAKVRNLSAHSDVACLVVSEAGPEGGWLSMRGRADVYQPSAAEVAALVPASSPDHRVQDAIVHKVRDRLARGKRCVIRVSIDVIVDAYLAPKSGSDDAAT